VWLADPAHAGSEPCDQVRGLEWDIELWAVPDSIQLNPVRMR
jgi:hypothetical protein